mmetsp:Transcript_6105/g.7364  ORF Transcript_6105/g.7364 Transcript_6105/m.7364 type:complete len:130 (+) Transcript_6105:425-814(+)
MGFCPVPHTSREQFWLCFGAGLSLSVNLLYTFYSRKRERSAGNRLIEASLGAPKKVVDLPERTICEYVGNAATADPSISIAVSNITKSCTEGMLYTNALLKWLNYDANSKFLRRYMYINMQCRSPNEPI